LSIAAYNFAQSVWLIKNPPLLMGTFQTFKSLNKILLPDGLNDLNVLNYLNALSFFYIPSTRAVRKRSMAFKDIRVRSY
jgi:hypothetical protein